MDGSVHSNDHYLLWTLGVLRIDSGESFLQGSIVNRKLLDAIPLHVISAYSACPTVLTDSPFRLSKVSGKT